MNETTKNQYFQEGKYSPERLELHHRIINEFLSSCQPSKQQAVAIFMGGGSASGKSVLIQNVCTMYNQYGNFLVIDSDRIKEKIPEYQDLIKAGAKDAASVVHDESSDIATRLYYEALSRNINLIFDGTFKNVDKYRNFLDTAKQNHYRITLFIADVPVEVALKRNQVRGDLTGRYVEEQIIRDSHKQVPQTFQALKDRFDDIYLHDCVEAYPYQFYVKVKEKVYVNLQDRMQEFLRKGGVYELEKPLLLKDLLKQIQGMPEMYTQVDLTPTKLNSPVASYQIRNINEEHLDLFVKLDNDISDYLIRMKSYPYISDKLKEKLLERAAIEKPYPEQEYNYKEIER